MLYAALKGALYNVSINLLSIKESDRRSALSGTVDSMLGEGGRLRDSVLAVVEKKLVQDPKK